MPKSANQKLRVLYLMRLLLTETDETHMITMDDILLRLAEQGVNAERKAIYDDFEALRTYGLDIIKGKSKSYAYYVASRDFELPELKLLADAVQSSKFITQRKSLALIKKLEKLASRHEAGNLRRQIHVQNRVKSMNESIYYNIDSLHEAITEGKKISFYYFDYNVKKEQILRRDGKLYIASPAALTWSEENYYLLAYFEGKEGVTHLRVDKMTKVTLLEERSEPRVKDFRLTDYTKKVFGMYGGEEADVRLRVDNYLIHPFLDRFGKDLIMIPDGDSHFTTTFRATLSPVFYGWLFQFGEMCDVISPQILKDELKSRADSFSARLG